MTRTPADAVLDALAEALAPRVAALLRAQGMADEPDEGGLATLKAMGYELGPAPSPISNLFRTDLDTESGSSVERALGVAALESIGYTVGSGSGSSVFQTDLTDSGSTGRTSKRKRRAKR